MNKFKHVNVITSIVLYSVFLIGVVSTILAAQDIAYGITNTIFGIVYYAMMALIPLSIGISIAYLIINKNKKDIICLCLSIASLTWYIVVLYAVANALKGF